MTFGSGLRVQLRRFTQQRTRRQDALRAPYASLACERCSDLRWIQERLWWIPEAQLDRRISMLDPLLLLLLPHIMSLQKERLDLPFVAASRQFPIPPASCQRHRGLVVGMVLIPTDHALEGLLGAPIGAIHIMTAGALLGRVRSADGVGGHTLFGRGPGQLLWDMPQLGSIQIRVHGTSMEAHGGQHSDPHK